MSRTKRYVITLGHAVPVSAAASQLEPKWLLTGAPITNPGLGPVLLGQVAELSDRDALILAEDHLVEAGVLRREHDDIGWQKVPNAADPHRPLYRMYLPVRGHR